MSRGVHVRFLRLLNREGVHARRVALRAAGWAAALLVLAELVDPGRMGRLVWCSMAGLVIGIAMGWRLADRADEQLAKALREGWHAWQDASSSSRDVLEAARQVGGAVWRPPAARWGVVVPALGFLYAWFAEPRLVGWVGWGAAIAFMASGVIIALQPLHAWRVARWTTELRTSTEALIAEGRVGVRGSL